jgi:transglutaminase-like putative cysteine protease
VSPTFFSPLSRAVTRPLSLLVLIAWAATMGLLVHRSYVEASPGMLATDLARYGPTATWRGVYYRGEKIGFTVSQTTRIDDGFELQEDGRLQMLLLGQDTAATIRTTARVDAQFMLRDFEFSLDPGTGPVRVQGRLDRTSNSSKPYRLTLAIASGRGTRTETHDLQDAPVLALNLSRVLASRRLVPGTRYEWTVLDPATLQNAAMKVRVGERSVVRTSDTSVPAFRVESEFQGLRTTSWVTDTGVIVREESPLGLMTVLESPERARGMSIPERMQGDLLRASAIVPTMRGRIDEPRDVRRLRVQLEGATLPSGDLNGAGQTASGDVVEIVDAQVRQSEPAATDAGSYLAAEPLIESDAPEIRAEAEQAVRGADSDRVRAERLTRYVNGLLDKKPTVSLPSAREVLRTKVGDCNEHTALYVAMARSIGLPSRIAVGLVYMHGAFYYHAWPEVYIAEGRRGLPRAFDNAQGRPERVEGRAEPKGLWMPVDPTLNQFPADATHLRLARGGLDRQAAVLPLIGRLKMKVLDIELAPGANPVIVGRNQ